MKKLSIKLRVTLWFTVFMMLLVVIVSVVLLHAEKKIKITTIQQKLTETVSNAEDFNKNEISGKILRPIDNVYISVYDSNGMLAGIIPDDFQQTVAFKEEKPHIIQSDDKSWYIYDVLSKKEHGTFLWFRGVLPVDNSANANDIYLMLIIYILPFTVIAVALLGYLIISHAFKPINEIIKTADKIGSGEDLSQRINLGEGKDEIYTLAKTFDSMFERLEGYFENEKRFTSDASHELRTPTSVIISQCEYALENTDTVEEAKEALTKIKEQATKMSSLIANLLTLARLDNRQYNKWKKETINLSELVDVIVDQQSEFAQEKGISIKEECEPDIFIFAEETLIMRMLINLIENAIQYGKENGNIKVYLRKKDCIELKIEDDGIGIAEENLNKIWERFYQVDPSRNNLRNNTGLGLAMVKWIVEAHKGKISVQSELGKGTIFTVTLPSNEN
jgi:signal transduction histidine kinase